MAVAAKSNRLIPFEHVIYRATPSGGMLVDLHTGLCFGLNRVGAEVWVRLAAGETIATTIEAIRQSCSIQAEVAESDVSRLCEEIVRAGLVECSDKEQARS